jgi:hypothetical protein
MMKWRLNRHIETNAKYNIMEYSHDFDFLWDPKQRTRAQQLSEKHSRENIRLWLRYVIEGGARDMYEFTDKYRNRVRYIGLKGWGNEEKQQDYHDKIKTYMQLVSKKPEFNYLFCPFMKKRAMDLVSTGIDYDLLSSILYYIMTGRTDVLAVNERAKLVYLTKMGIFP